MNQDLARQRKPKLRDSYSIKIMLNACLVLYWRLISNSFDTYFFLFETILSSRKIRIGTKLENKF